MYEYFVSYFYSKTTGFIFGNMQIFMPKKVKTYSDINKMRKCIDEKVNTTDSIIISYQYLGRVRRTK